MDEIINEAGKHAYEIQKKNTAMEFSLFLMLFIMHIQQLMTQYNKVILSVYFEHEIAMEFEEFELLCCIEWKKYLDAQTNKFRVDEFETNVN